MLEPSVLLGLTQQSQQNIESNTLSYPHPTMQYLGTKTKIHQGFQSPQALVCNLPHVVILRGQANA